VTVSQPSDSARVVGDTVELSGTVTPADARVLVDGREASGDGAGGFTATVALDPGANVVDVVAGAPRRRPAMLALRVVRELPVTIPDLSGRPPDEAERRLRDLGLEVKVRRRAGLLEDLIPGGTGVCGSDPKPGRSVEPGSTVELTVSKTC
jgi:serine/threonine-protein kinase